MPMTFAISAEGMLRSKVLPPGVYVLNINNISQGPGRNDPASTTTTINFVVESGPTGTGPEVVGVPVRYWLSEKADGLSVGFFEAVTGRKVPQTGAQFPTLETLIGRKVKGYIKNDMWQGRPTNKIDGFLPM